MKHNRFLKNISFGSANLVQRNSELLPWPSKKYLLLLVEPTIRL